MNEASKAYKRRRYDPRFSTWISGKAVDIGCGHDAISKEMYPGLTEVTKYDRILGHADATTVPELKVGEFDCVHSAHCLEHLHDPRAACVNWLRLLKPGGVMVVTVPEAELYEQGYWPSRFNPDHKTAWRILGSIDDGGHYRCVFDLLGMVREYSTFETLLVQRCEEGYDWNAPPGVDQTLGEAESAIEFVVRKL